MDRSNWKYKYYKFMFTCFRRMGYIFLFFFPVFTLLYVFTGAANLPDNADLSVYNVLWLSIPGTILGYFLTKINVQKATDYWMELMY